MRNWQTGLYCVSSRYKMGHSFCLRVIANTSLSHFELANKPDKAILRAILVPVVLARRKTFQVNRLHTSPSSVSFRTLSTTKKTRRLKEQRGEEMESGDARAPSLYTSLACNTTLCLPCLYFRFRVFCFWLTQCG